MINSIFQIDPTHFNYSPYENYNPYEDYGVETLSNYEREREVSVYDKLKRQSKRESKMTQENQMIHDKKIDSAGAMYKDLPPWAQKFVDDYRATIIRAGRINGTGPDELLIFIEKVKGVVDKTADNIFESANKGVVGIFHKGSGV